MLNNEVLSIRPEKQGTYIGCNDPFTPDPLLVLIVLSISE